MNSRVWFFRRLVGLAISLGGLTVLVDQAITQWLR